MFCRDYPRGLVNRLWLCCFPALDTLPVAPALPVPFLLPRFRLPVALLRLPLRPLSRCLPAARTALALACLPGMKTLLAAFQQTTAHPRPTRPSLPPIFLIFGMACRTLGRAHGR